MLETIQLFTNKLFIVNKIISELKNVCVCVEIHTETDFNQGLSCLHFTYC